MKILLCLAVVVVVVTSEPCDNVGDCSHVSCDSETTLGCSHHECTCLESAQNAPCQQTTCGVQSDCNNCLCRSDREHHCYDGHCTCGFGFGK